MELKPIIIKPGRPITPSSPPGSYQNGAVRFAPHAYISGSSALNGDGSGIFGQFTKGVISFWTDFDPTVGLLGDSAEIVQTNLGSNTPGPNTALTNCVNLLASPGTNIAQQAFPMGSIGIFLDQFGVKLCLVDASTSKGLLSVSLNYVSGSGTTDTLQWANLGSFGSLYHGNNSLWNGIQYGPFQFLASACGGEFITWTTGSISNTGGQFATDCINDLFHLPPPNPGSFKFLFHGVNGQLYPSAQFPADVLLVQTTSVGGTPPDGKWHHYVCSFDTSQLVTDVNGAQCIRAQIAMDRGGGPITGGPLMDTAATSVGPNSQPMFSQLEQGGGTGSVAIAATSTVPGTGDTWRIGAPSDASFGVAYAYMGIVPAGGRFFDLTAPRQGGGINLDYFITPQLTPVNFGLQGINIPLLCNWMHTGNATLLLNGGSTFARNAANFEVWPVQGGQMSTTNGPPLGA